MVPKPAPVPAIVTICGPAVLANVLAITASGAPVKALTRCHSQPTAAFSVR